MSTVSVLLLLSVALPAADQPPLPSLEQVRAAYTEAVTSIHTLDCEMRYRTLSNTQDPNRTGYVGANVHLWKKGTLRAVQTGYLNAQDQVVSLNWMGYNGQTYSEWSAQPEIVTENRWLPHGKTESNRNNALYDTLTVDTLLGEMLVSGNLPLTRLMTQGASELTWEDIDGQQCVKITFPRHMSSRYRPERLSAETTAWLDPEHHYLPRRILSRDFSNGENEPPMERETRITTFQRLRGEDGKDYLFPEVGEYRDILVHILFEMESAKVNGSLSDSRFSPQFPPLTKVTEDLANQPRRVRIVGDAAQREKIEREEFERLLEIENASRKKGSDQTMANPPPQTDASPAAAKNPAQWVRIGLSLASVCAFCYAWRLYRS